jgi:hypothetical protein
VIVILSNAGVQPLAMVVEFVATSIAVTAMLGKLLGV